MQQNLHVQQLKTIIMQIQSLMERIYHGESKDSALDLGSQFNDLIASLENLSGIPFCQMHIPLDLLGGLDSGEIHSPDSYWEAMLLKLQLLNAKSNGRVKTLEAFLRHLESENERGANNLQ